MAETVLVGYRPMPLDAQCPHCGDAHGMIADDGDPSTYKYRCWCGSTARVPREDPDVLRLIGEANADH